RGVIALPDTKSPRHNPSQTLPISKINPERFKSARVICDFEGNGWGAFGALIRQGDSLCHAFPVQKMACILS
ncbi:hypothetical protein, partial [Streptomyces solaniscabiei]|uniref:hypothetical protein n=1 Tax=Streptomyces solaniscabiei TaxID=2683255 RepID=UPI001CE2D16F